MWAAAWGGNTGLDILPPQKCSTLTRSQNRRVNHVTELIFLEEKALKDFIGGMASDTRAP